MICKHGTLPRSHISRNFPFLIPSMDGASGVEEEFQKLETGKYKPRIVLFGKTGVGKSTLVNNMFTFCFGEVCIVQFYTTGVVQDDAMVGSFVLLGLRSARFSNTLLSKLFQGMGGWHAEQRAEKTVTLRVVVDQRCRQSY